MTGLRFIYTHRKETTQREDLRKETSPFVCVPKNYGGIRELHALAAVEQPLGPPAWLPAPGSRVTRAAKNAKMSHEERKEKVEQVQSASSIGGHPLRLIQNSMTMYSLRRSHFCTERRRAPIGQGI